MLKKLFSFKTEIEKMIDLFSDWILKILISNSQKLTTGKERF